MIAYDPRYHTFESWSALMCEAYSDQGLPIEADESKWLDWADSFIDQTDLDKEGLVAPRAYLTWDAWATALLNLSNSGA
jgi:hypothetical protein